VFLLRHKDPSCTVHGLRSAPAVIAGTRLLAAAGSRRVAAGVCADWGGGVAGLAPPPAAARPPLLGVLLRCAAARTAPATAPPSPCCSSSENRQKRVVMMCSCTQCVFRWSQRRHCTQMCAAKGAQQRPGLRSHAYFRPLLSRRGAPAALKSERTFQPLLLSASSIASASAFSRTSRSESVSRTNGWSSRSGHPSLRRKSKGVPQPVLVVCSLRAHQGGGSRRSGHTCQQTQGCQRPKVPKLG
jgi:hypothetical protein